MPELSASEYRNLLREALNPTVDADTISPSAGTLFTPDSHRLALDPDITVVQGARGVGKTVWHKALQDSDLRGLASGEYQIGALQSIQAVSGYGSERAPAKYPGPNVLRQLMSERHAPVDIWNAVLLVALGHDEVVEIRGWSGRVSWVRQNPETLEETIAQADDEFGGTHSSFLLLFDALDRLSEDRAIADELVGGILKLALDLRISTRHLRAKVFIRPDMFGSARANFPDASKLGANASELRWSDANLYGLLFHQLGNSTSPVAERFRRSTGKWRTSDERRYLPPPELTGDRKRQQEVFVAIAGPYMGRGHRKGHTYQWLPNHLMDGAEQVSPRSFLSALTKAAEITASSHESHDFPLHYEAIRNGVQEASRIRVSEIQEDMPWVATAIECLEGTQVPIESDQIARLWVEHALFDRLLTARSASNEDERTRTGPRGSDASSLIEDLMSLGVMTTRRDGRVDLPDVYRIAFNIGRKGGVPRVAASR